MNIPRARAAQAETQRVIVTRPSASTGVVTQRRRNKRDGRMEEGGGNGRLCRSSRNCASARIIVRTRYRQPQHRGAIE